MTIPSPCIEVCALDAATGRCAGCLRTLDEIAAWGGLDDAGKLAIWARLAARRAESGGAGDMPLNGPCVTPVAAGDEAP